MSLSSASSSEPKSLIDTSQNGKSQKAKPKGGTVDGLISAAVAQDFTKFQGAYETISADEKDDVIFELYKTVSTNYSGNELIIMAQFIRVAIIRVQAIKIAKDLKYTPPSHLVAGYGYMGVPVLGIKNSTPYNKSVLI